jgi:uncharacterized membrane protein
MLLPFLNPWLLLATLGVAVPIAIHLLNRHRYRKVEWAAMELLRRSVRMRSRKLRIEDLLLLLLRCLAVLLLALAVARPTTKWLGAVKKADVGAVIALDVSYSMTQKPGVESRFDRAIGRVREILAGLEPGNPVTLVLMGKRPRVALRNVGYDVQRLEQALREIAPLAEEVNVEYCLAEIEPLLREIKAPERELYLVTDGQATTWAGPSDKARLLLDELRGLGRVFIVTGAAGAEENLAITRLELTSGVLRQGQIVRYTTEVRNHGRRPQDNVEISLFADGTAVDRQLIDRIAPGETASVPMYVPLTRAGDVRVEARLGHDPLTVDNVRYAVAHVRQELRILCVDGDPYGRRYKTAADYIITALAPRQDAQSLASMKIDSASWLALPSKRLADYDVVILANVPDFPQEKLPALQEFLERGGGLLLFMGDNVNPDALNRRLRYRERPLLPAEVQSAVLAGGPADRTGGRPIDVELPDHPLVRPLSFLPPELLSESRFRRFMSVNVHPEGRVLLKLAGGGEPILLERAIGRGKVLLFTSSADRKWNNAAINPLYPILLQQAMTYLSRLPHERQMTVGQPVVLAFPGRKVGSEFTVTDPAGQTRHLRTALSDGQVIGKFGDTRRPGFYKVALDADVPPLMLGANLGADESDVKVLGEQGLRTAFSGMPVGILAEGRPVAGAVQEARVGRELWGILVLATLMVLICESLLAGTYAKGHSAETDETADRAPSRRRHTSAGAMHSGA